MKYLVKYLKNLSLLAIAVILPQLANAYDFMVDGLCYNINSDSTSLTVTSYTSQPWNSPNYSYLTTANIPLSVTYNGITYSVTSIDRYAFARCRYLRSVTIPSSVISIGYNTFEESTMLESVIIDAGNKNYDSRDNCNAIIESTTNTLVSGCKNTIIPNSVTSIGSSAFERCKSLTSIVIPNSVKDIGKHAFLYCHSLTSITIPNSVTSIGDEAFSGCSGLTSVIIGSSVSNVNFRSVFSGSELMSIVVDSGNSTYDSRNNCNAIIETATNTLLLGCNNTIIPNSVTRIGVTAFSHCNKLNMITIPNSVTTIDNYAFEYCTGLTNLSIPNSVTSIGEGAFWYCSGLTSVSISNSVSSLEYRTFRNCTSLSSVTIPNSVTSIDSDAFGNCTGLKSLIITNSVSFISVYAFSGCSALTSVALTGQGAWNYNSSTHQGLRAIVPNIKYVRIGSGITSLGNFGFNPDTVKCYAENPPVCSYGTFSKYDGELHVPSASAVAYFTAEYWQNFNNLNYDLTDKVTLDKSTANLVQWETLALTATVVPEGSELIWSATNPLVATVDENGLVTALKEGECDIYATLASNPAVYAICHITTSYPEITLSLSEESLAMNVGDEQTLTLTISPDNTGLSPSWSSSNTSVATVENGVVKAFGEGECDITATVLDKTATCHVTVINNVIITLNVENAILGANQILTVYPSCSPDVPVELVVTSSDPSVAVARVVNRTNAPAVGLMSFTEMGMALNYLEELAVPSESKTPALASTKAIMIAGLQNGTATITVTTADGKAEPAVLELRVVDVDGDRTITSTDITCLYNYLLNGDDSFITTSDTNGDGFITSTDITVLYNLMLGN